MEKLTWTQTALKADSGRGHSREPTEICSNSNTSRLRAGPAPQLPEQPQHAQPQAPAQPLPRGGNARGIPAVSGGSGSRDSSPSAGQEPGALGGCSCKPQECRDPQHPAVSGQATTQLQLPERREADLPSGMHVWDTHDTLQPHQQATWGLAGMCHVPLLPRVLSSQHSHGCAWQNLDLCALPWGNLDTAGCFTSAFFLFEALFFRGNYPVSLFLFSKLSEDSFKTLKINQRLPILNYYACFKLKEMNL